MGDLLKFPNTNGGTVTGRFPSNTTNRSATPKHIDKDYTCPTTKYSKDVDERLRGGSEEFFNLCIKIEQNEQPKLKDSHWVRNIFIWFLILMVLMLFTRS